MPDPSAFKRFHGARGCDREKSTAVNLFEFGLSIGAANAIDGQAVVALEFLDCGIESISVGGVESARKISQVVEATYLARDFVDGIEMADFDGDDVVGERSLVAANGENTFFGIKGDFLFKLAVAVGG